jgi:hypothetical protein
MGHDSRGVPSPHRVVAGPAPPRGLFIADRRFSFISFQSRLPAKDTSILPRHATLSRVGRSFHGARLPVFLSTNLRRPTMAGLFLWRRESDGQFHRRRVDDSKRFVDSVPAALCFSSAYPLTSPAAARGLFILTPRWRIWTPGQNGTRSRSATSTQPVARSITSARSLQVRKPFV